MSVAAALARRSRTSSRQVSKAEASMVAPRLPVRACRMRWCVSASTAESFIGAKIENRRAERRVARRASFEQTQERALYATTTTPVRNRQRRLPCADVEKRVHAGLLSEVHTYIKEGKGTRSEG